MDPDEALKKLRESAARVQEVFDNYVRNRFDPLEGAAETLLTYAQALDDWLSKGGFLPADWNKNRGTGNDKSPDGGTQADSSA